MALFWLQLKQKALSLCRQIACALMWWQQESQKERMFAEKKNIS